MTEITSPPPLYAARSKPSDAAGQGEPKGGKAVVSSDFDTFLRMLTVQVQNQDPLNPVDSTDYATQLATFSSVEQQVLTNDLLREVGASLTGGALQEFSNWIGMEALVRAPALFDGSPVSLRPDSVDGADGAALLVRDESGDVIQRFDIDPGQENVVWGGADEEGASLPAGLYRFEVESYKEGALIDTRQAQVYNRIEEVRQSDGGVVLRFAGGTEGTPDLVGGLRATVA